MQTVISCTPILSITRDDFEWQFTKGSGKGGQKRNKTSSAVRCFHEPSGASGYSEAGRSQAQNRKDAFRKLTESREFQSWLRLETARRLGKEAALKEEVEKQMQASNLKVEWKVNGLWVIEDDSAGEKDCI